MRIEHAALYVTDLETSRTFYETYLEGKAGGVYHNPRTGLRTCFVRFDGGARLELMHRPDAVDAPKDALRTGFAHLAFSVGSREKVDDMTARLKADGYPVLSGPRVTGDGYYESCIADPEGNRIEITV